MVKNVRGSDGLGVNHYDRGRKGNKVSLIVTRHGIPLSMKVFGSNVHDVTALSEQIQHLEVKIIGSRVIGDKGYNSRKLRSQLNESGIKLIFPAKKNQKVKNTEEEKSLLKDRNIVENVFSWIQMRRRIKLRYDFYQYSYVEFYCLALSDLIIKKGILA